MPENTSPESQTQPHTTDAKLPIPAKDMVSATNAIKRAYSEDPEFDIALKTRQNQAEVVLEAWMKGEITKKQAAEIFGAREAELEMALETDPLMDLPNRTALENIMQTQIALARRNGTTISVGFIDLDKFGEINKIYENSAGDATLQAVGAFLKSELRRPTDKVGRKGGEEMLAVLPDTDEAGALHTLEGMRERMPDTVAELVRGIGYEFDRPITMSIGLVSEKIGKDDTRSDFQIMNDLIDKADSRMRLAKNNGRNQVVGTARETALQTKTEVKTNV